MNIRTLKLHYGLAIVSGGSESGSEEETKDDDVNLERDSDNEIKPTMVRLLMEDLMVAQQMSVVHELHAQVILLEV